MDIPAGRPHREVRETCVDEADCEDGDLRGDLRCDLNDVTEAQDALQRTLEASVRVAGDTGSCCCACAGAGASEEEATPMLASSMNSVALRQEADGRWSWFVAVCAFINCFVIDGITFSAGILYEYLLKEGFLPGRPGRGDRGEPGAGGGRGQLILVESVLTGVYLGSAPLVSMLGDRFGYRPVSFVGAAVGCVGFVAASFTPLGNIGMMVALYSVVGGIGLGLTYLPSMVMTALHFEKHRPLAMGFVTSGSGLGIVLFSVMSPVIYGNLGWRGMMRIQAGMIAVGLLTSLSFRPIVSLGEESFLSVLRKRLRSLVRLPAFWLLACATFIGTSGVISNFALIPVLGQQRRVTFAYLITIIGAVSVVARFLITAVIQAGCVTSLPLLALCHVTGGLVTMFTLYYRDFTALALLATVIGIVYADASLTQQIIADSLGRRYLSVGFGILCLLRGAAALISPPILKTLGNLTLAFRIVGGAFLLTSLLALAMALLRRRRAHARATYRQSEELPRPAPDAPPLTNDYDSFKAAQT